MPNLDQTETNGEEMSKDNIKEQKQRYFIFGMIVAIAIALPLQYFDVSDMFWDYIQFGERVEISCDDLESYYQKNHLSPDWTEKDEAGVQFLRYSCK